MKNLMFKSFLIIALLVACQEDDIDLDQIIVPSNLTVSTDISTDGSGLVTFMASADDAITYKYVFPDGSSSVAPSGIFSYTFSETGLNTYTVTAIAYGAGGVSSSILLDVEVLVTYAPPPELLEKLVGKEWRIKAEQGGHFGLGPVGGNIPSEFFGAGANEKVGVGMYDDRYIFAENGSFIHITDNTNDDPTTDPSGTVFGRINLIDELGSDGGEVQGADVVNLPYSDYTENWSLIAPGGVETIVLTGIGFIGYYTGGDHRYEIYNRSVPNELMLRTTDGNNEFDWWFIITSEEEGNTNTNETFDDLIWSDEFDVNGSPDPNNWTYDIGTGSNGWGNNESQYYTDREDNVVVEDGLLKIIAKAENFEGSEYTSARLKTENLFEFTYGRVEVMAKLPSGGGTWPAIWTLGADFDTVGWPEAGEMDIMEHVGNNQNTIISALHFPGNSGGNAIVGTTTATDVSNEFHLYALEWTADEIRFYVDDNLFHSYSNEASLPFNKDFFLILNVAMGGTLGGAIDASFTSSTLEVDYVRVYQ